MVSERGKKFVCHFAGSAIDEARSHLSQLATHAGLYLIGQSRIVLINFGQGDTGIAFAEPSRATLYATLNRVTFGWIQITKFELCLECGTDGAHLGLHFDIEMMFIDLRNVLAAGDASAKDFRIIERGPNDLTRRWNIVFACLFRTYLFPWMPGTLTYRAS